MKRVLMVLFVCSPFLGAAGGRSQAQIPIDRSKLRKAVTFIRVTSPIQNYVYATYDQISIDWDTSNIKNHPTVYIEIVWADGTPGGGAYPVSNTGHYVWQPDASLGHPDYRCKPLRAKVMTTDRKYSGTSSTFQIGKFRSTHGNCN